MEERKTKIGFIGAGKVGSALALLLQQAGYEIVGIASRTRVSAENLANRLGCPVLTAADVARRAGGLFLTTTDDAVPSVVARLGQAGAFYAGQIVLHTSGALTSEALKPAAKQGAFTLSLHPLQSFASVEQALTVLPGSFFSIEGDARGFSFAREIIAKLEGKYFFLDAEAKVLYHAAACTASNYFVSLLACSLDLLAAAGIPAEMRLPALLPLIRGTLDNIDALGIPAALTGPISRGDRGTVEKHLAALKDLPEQLQVYASLGIFTAGVARAKGTIDGQQAGAIRALLEGARGSSSKPAALR